MRLWVIGGQGGGIGAALIRRLKEAIASAPALKILLPLPRTGVDMVGFILEPLPHLVNHKIILVEK